MNRNVSSPFFVYICNCCFSNGVCYLNLIFMKIFRQEISESHYNIVKGERVVELLCRYKWFVLGENGANEMLTFREDGLLTISNKGKRRQGVWRYNTHARLVYLSKSPHSCYLSPFFWNKVVLVLRLREEDGYLFLINAAAKRFDCMVLEDFNAYASQWEQGQAVKREKVEFLKKMRSEPVKLVSKWEEMGVGEDLSDERFIRLAELWIENERLLKEKAALKQKQSNEKLKSDNARLLAEQKEMTERDFQRMSALEKQLNQLEQQRNEARDEVSQLIQRLIKEIELCIDLMKERQELNQQKNDALLQLDELKKQLESREQPDRPNQAEQPRQAEQPHQAQQPYRLEEQVQLIKQTFLRRIKMEVGSYLRSESLDIDITTDRILSKDKKYKKMKRKKIIVAITMAVLVVFAFSGFWSTIQYDETNSYFESVAYSSFLFIGAVSTILVYCVYAMNEESYKMELKRKIEEKLRNNFINSLKL